MKKTTFCFPFRLLFICFRFLPSLSSLVFIPLLSPIFNVISSTIVPSISSSFHPPSHSLILLISLHPAFTHFIAIHESKQLVQLKSCNELNGLHDFCFLLYWSFITQKDPKKNLPISLNRLLLRQDCFCSWKWHFVLISCVQQDEINSILSPNSSQLIDL